MARERLLTLYLGQIISFSTGSRHDEFPQVKLMIWQTQKLARSHYKGRIFNNTWLDKRYIFVYRINISYAKYNMPKRLPPLNALKAFEVAARTLSFTRAAEELHVTQAAVSHQIKLLEQSLGIKLFRRLNRALRLTDAGQAYLPSVSKAFELLSEATNNLDLAQQRGTLTVTVLPSFAARWLVPRLGKFLRAYPEIDVRIAPAIETVDFASEDVDIGIRYGMGNWPGLRATWLMNEDIYPVCSPQLLEGAQPLRGLSDLKNQVLLHDDGHDDWNKWLMAAGVADVDPLRGPVITDSSMLLQAAIGGEGVALARSVLVAEDLSAGRLIKPFALNLPAQYAYYVVHPESVSNSYKINSFRDWLLSESED